MLIGVQRRKYKGDSIRYIEIVRRAWLDSYWHMCTKESYSGSEFLKEDENWIWDEK